MDAGAHLAGELLHRGAGVGVLRCGRAEAVGLSYLVEIWLAAGLVALAAGAAGYIVVLRRAGFAAHALPMAAFPGAAAASLFGFPLWAGLAGFALGGAGLLALVQRSVRRDAATALL
ncbi:MAG: metal ABC transporter permease, partial [Rhodospirillales bacterium]|nr:metal ABC transporter permease [Rhodospirillales bacterium]